MAVTGVVLFGFVIAHMIGNLQLYLGREAINHYAVVPPRVPPRRRTLDRPRRPARVGRPAHLVGERRSRWTSWTARPVGLPGHDGAGASTYASRTMRWSGPILLPLHRLPPAAPDRRAAAHPELRRRGRLPQRRRRASRSWPVVGRSTSWRCCCPRPAPRHGVWSMLPDARASASAVERAAPQRARRSPSLVVARQHLRSRWPSSPAWSGAA